MRLLLTLCLLCLAACAEMRTPAPVTRIPPGLGVLAADPLPAIMDEAAAALAGDGLALAGRPAATARAIGQAEFIAAEIRRDPRWAPMPAAVEAELRAARAEWRNALGIRAGAAPEAVAAALGRAAIALGANETARASAALDPALFDPGGIVTLARLAAPGPLPQTAFATRAVRDAAARLQALQVSGAAAALDPNATLSPMGIGLGETLMLPMR